MDPFVHLPDHGAIICTKCKHAVLPIPSAIHTHLGDRVKHNIIIQERIRIIKVVTSIPGLRISKEQFDAAGFPPPTNAPIPELKAPRTDGNQCTSQDDEGRQCQFISCHIDQIRSHCIQKHHWKNPQKGGRPEAGREVQVPWRTSVHCQHFFVRGPGAEYFEVGRVEGPRQAREETDIDKFESDQREIDELIQKANEAAQEIQEPDEAKEPNPWVSRVGWAVHLARFNTKEMRKLVAPPGEGEEDLELLGKAFKWLIQDAQHHAVRKVVGIHTLFVVNKKEVDREPSMPFNSWMDQTTINAYVDVWQRLLFFICRVEELDENQRPGYEMTVQQRIAYDAMQSKIQEYQEWKEEQGDSSPDVESTEEIQRMGWIQQRILGFCIELLNHSIGANEYESAIISGLAVLGIREDGKWYDAEDYTTKYSAIHKL